MLECVLKTLASRVLRVDPSITLIFIFCAWGREESEACGGGRTGAARVTAGVFFFLFFAGRNSHYVPAWKTMHVWRRRPQKAEDSRRKSH